MLQAALTWFGEHMLTITTVVLVGATCVLAYHTSELRKASERTAKEQIWQSREEHFQRMIRDAQGQPGNEQAHARWELLAIAEEWGPGRHRDGVIRLFRKLAAREDEERKHPGGEDIIRVSAFLEEWDRNGIDHNPRMKYEGVDEGRWRPYTLATRLWNTFQIWRYEGKTPEPKVSSKGIQRGIQAVREAMHSAAMQIRETGSTVFVTEMTWPRSTRDGEPYERPVVSGADTTQETDWSKVPRQVKDWRWTIDAFRWGEKGTNEAQVKLEATGSWTWRKPEGEWRITAEVSIGEGTKRRIWKWRADGPTWVLGEGKATQEIRAAAEALIAEARTQEQA